VKTKYNKVSVGQKIMGSSKASKIKYSIMKISSIIKNIFETVKKIRNASAYRPSYRVIEVIKNKDGAYTVHIQVINSSSAFYAKPEELLADDNIVNLFSPLDVRTLTYLGYLGINSPKYKILAQRLVDESNLVFVVEEKGSEGIIFKTASEIMRDNNFLQNMNAADASIIGYTSATESAVKELKQKEREIVTQHLTAD
jgi:hypothetical protein